MCILVYVNSCKSVSRSGEKLYLLWPQTDGLP